MRGMQACATAVAGRAAAMAMIMMTMMRRAGMACRRSIVRPAAYLHMLSTQNQGFAASAAPPPGRVSAYVWCTSTCAHALACAPRARNWSYKAPPPSPTSATSTATHTEGRTRTEAGSTPCLECPPMLAVVCSSTRRSVRGEPKEPGMLAALAWPG